MIKSIAASMVLAFSAVPGAFAQVDFDRGAGDLKASLAGVDVPQVSAPAEVKGWFSHNNNNAAVQPQAPKEWTVMVYMNGKNDLEVAGLYNLNKMEMVGSNASLNILTETGRMNGQQNDVHFDGNWTGSRRFYVTQDSDENVVKSKAVQTFSKVDMGDWKHLAEFAKWGKQNYPAKHYALIVWNHGSGWITDKKGLSANKGISYDFETKNHISTPELGAAMKEIGKVDILAYDACLMQMAEVLYEVKDYADFVVGSEETVPGLGFPYDTMLPAFSANKSSGELAAGMVRAYDGFYASKGKKVTLSAVRMSEFGGFMAAFNAWTEALQASDKKPQIKAKAYSAASYAYEDNKDLFDFARLAAEADPALAEKGRAMTDALTGKLLIDNMAYKETYGRDEASHGLAIYLPVKGYNEKYDQLAWSRDTRWDDFLKEMKGVTAPGLEFMNGCTDPGPGATLQQLLAYADCLTNAINAAKP